MVEKIEICISIEAAGYSAYAAVKTCQRIYRLNYGMLECVRAFPEIEDGGKR